MTPHTVLAGQYGTTNAALIIELLKDAGFIIVPKGAIGRAQDDAVREYVAANDNVAQRTHKAA